MANNGIKKSNYCLIHDIALSAENAFISHVRGYEYFSCKLCAHDRSNEWHKNNRESALATMAERFEKKPGSYAYATIKAEKRVKSGRIPLSISKEDFCKWFDSTPHVCDYCGLTEQESKEILNKRITIDRKDNSVGYVLENIVFACAVCNTHKGDFFTYEEWKEIAQKYRVAERTRLKLKEEIKGEL